VRAALYLCVLAVGCGSPTTSSDFIEVQGHDPAGNAVNLHLTGSTGLLQSLILNVITETIETPATGPADLRGLRLELVASAVSAGQTYDSGPSGPAVFYVLRPNPDGGIYDYFATLVMRGSVTLVQAGALYTGTLSNLVVVDAGAPTWTFTTGSFQMTKH
jgi:hypothetical protein